ncbi:TonB-dependent receptor domain-containing protein [Chondromyces apiculatus]|uniref:TonB-dependent receptor n=1 Tax=Chondromyces apiculatus DSM 436 TaxID=1192034 RepID=A0A017TDD7_9BACT|nr:TonB-dependent receptor [Chondromyces apiculatus]EYF07313.1 TonB-dependent receptor [Chondromyces apiculatus DSM 436]
MKRPRGSRWRRRSVAALARGTAALAAVAVLAAGPGPVRADGVADESELHFQLGATSYQQGNYLEALEHFLLSNRLVPNRRVVFNIALTYEHLQRYAEAHRYYVDALAGEEDAAVRKTVEEATARVAPRVALLDVITTPPGATIYLDRVDLGSWGQSPRPMAVPPGRYRVIAQLEGYEPAAMDSVEATVGKEAQVALTLKRIVGTVQVEVTGASGATVRVDDERGAPVCTAPCALDLPPGVHQLHFEREGYVGAPRQVTVAAKATTRVTAVMTPLSGSVLVRTDEPGALITIDGRPLGFTPVVLRDVPAGERQLRVALRGHVPVTVTVTVRPGEQAQVPPITLEPRREVTAVSRTTELLDDAPSSVSVLDGRELRAFGYPTIVEALRGVRGVALSNDRGYASASIRGLGQPNDYGNRLLVLSDGQPLNDNLLNSAYIGSDGRVDLHDVDRIEVVRGPGSLLYGAGALSGVINLVTRPRDVQTGVHAGFGTYDDAVLHARVGGQLNLGRDRGAWASVSGAHSDGFTVNVPLRDGSGTPAVGGVEAFKSGGTAGRAWWGPATVQWLLHHREQSIPVGGYATTLGDPRTQFDDTRMMVELRVEPKLGEQLQLMTRVHGNRYVFGGLYAFDDPVEGSLDNVETYKGTWFGGEARLVYTPKIPLRLTVGAEAQHHPEASMFGDTVTASGTTSYLDSEQSYSFAAAYALAEGSPLPWLKLSGGARVDVYSTFGPIVVPRAAVIMKPVTGGTLKVMGGRAFRAPSIYEQRYEDGGLSQVVAVDEERGLSLEPESVYSGEVEYTQRFLKDWAVIGAGHVSYVEGIIATIPDTPGSALVRYENITTPALVAGGDLELRREWRQGWMLSAAYGYQRAQYLNDGPGNPRLVNVPEHLASLRGVFPIVRELASLGLRMTLETPRRIIVPDDAVTTTQLVADATLSGQAREMGLQYVVGVYNLADRRWEVPVTDTFASRVMPQNGRTFRLDLLWSYP